MSSSPRIHLAVIAAESVPSRWARWFLRWISEGANDADIFLDWERAVDIGEARSRAIDAGRARGASNHWQIDTDVQVQNPIREIVELLADDTSRGFDLVTSPGMSTAGVLEVFPLETSDVDPTGPFAVGTGWGGFISLTDKLLQQLPVTGHAYDLNQHTMRFYSFIQPEITCPHCFKVIPGASEDTMIYRSAMQLGMKAAADPRIRTMHIKSVGLPSYRPGMTVTEAKRDAEED